MQVNEVVEQLRSRANPTPENLKGMARYGINTERPLDSVRRATRIDLRKNAQQAE